MTLDQELADLAKYLALADSDSAAAVCERARAVIDSLSEALKDAEEMLVVAMGNDLHFSDMETKEIIDGHSGMIAIRTARKLVQ